MLRILTAGRPGVFLLAAGVVLVAAACSGSAAVMDSTATPPPQVEPAATVTPTPAPTPVPSQIPAPDPAVTPNIDLVTRGKLLFEKTAGGTGCATCHGLDAQGIPELAAPANIGATEDQIWGALQDRPQMSFIKLTDEEIKAVAAYLRQLADQQ